MERQILPSLPFRVEIEVTGRCNLSCANCYAQPLSGFEPAFNDLKYILQKTKNEANPFEVILLGGEPFIRADIMPVLKEARDLFGAAVAVSTNGVKFATMSESDMSQLREVSGETGFIQVSLDSVKPTINDLLRGRTEEALIGMSNLEKHHIHFSVAIVVSNQNISDVPSTVKSLITSMQYLNGINLNPIQLPSSSSGEHRKLIINRQQMVNLVEEVRQIASASGRKMKVVNPEEACECKAPALLDSYRVNTCFAGVFRACVLPNGTVSPCSVIRNGNLGNLYQESWRQIWSRAAERFKTLDGIQCNGEAVKFLRSKEGEMAG